MNLTKHTLLFALMIPALVTLAACDREAADDAYVAPAATDAAPVTDPTPAEQTMPADRTMPPIDEGMGMAGDEMAFVDMDTNQDGGISMDELTPEQMLYQHFAVADADGDGMLSEEEINQHRADMGIETPESY